MSFVPAIDSGRADLKAAALAEYVQNYVSLNLYGQAGRFHITSTLHANSAAVLDAFRTGETDLAPMSTLDYLLTLDEAGLNVHPFVSAVPLNELGLEQGFILVRSASPIECLEDLNGKRIAWEGRQSIAGYALPAALLESNGVVLGASYFADEGSNVLTELATGAADAGALSTDQQPGPEWRILAEVGSVPGDPWVIREDLRSDSAEQERIELAVREGLLEFARTEPGRQVLDELLDMGGLGPAAASTYEDVRVKISIGESSVQ